MKAKIIATGKIKTIASIERNYDPSKTKYSLKMGNGETKDYFANELELIMTDGGRK